MIEFRNVSKSFSGKPVLRDISFNIAPGERMGLLGVSGSGKSTILRLIAGLISPDSGTVRVESRHLGYIFQENRLLPWKTAEENVAFSLMAEGLPRREALLQARGFLEKVELENYAHYYPGQLSGGMCQRVSIARAFVTSPDIVLMDEPFSALDPALKDRMHRLVISLLKDTPASIVYVTHNAEELPEMTNRIQTINASGRLEKEGMGTLSNIAQSNPVSYS